MKIKNNRLIVVLGMHRSGTSVITRGLQVFGVQLGDKMMPPTEGINPKGYWEDVDLNALNIEMLHAIGNDWCRVRVIGSSDVEFLHKHGYFRRAVDLIREKTGSSPLFAFKDPRVAKLLSFWKEVFVHCQLDVSYLLAVRNPLSVVKSLTKRDGIEAEQSYLLWFEHLITGLTHSVGKKRVLVDYDRLMQSPAHELSRIAESLELEIDPAELKIYKTKFLDKGLRHTVYNLNDLLLDSTCPPIVHETYLALLDLASDNVGFDALEGKVALWSDEFERLSSPIILIDKLFVQNTVANQAIAERDVQVSNLSQAVAERDVQVTNLSQAIAEHNVQVTNLSQAIAERDVQVANLNQAIAERDILVANLNQAVAERDVQVANLNQAVAERDQQFDTVDSEIVLIKSSKTWKLLRRISQLKSLFIRI